MKHRYISARYKSRQVRHTYGGVSLDITIADPVGESWYDHDWPELPEITFLRRHRLGPGARVFNLGAHQGVVALMLAKEVGSEGLVVAVEANSHNASVSLRNQNLNRAEQLRVLYAAVAERSGKVFTDGSLNSQVVDGRVSKWGLDEIRAFSIDDLTRQYGIPDVLFIDIEGFECQALRGARETLRHSPDCFVEVHVGTGLERLGGSVEQVLSFFPKTDYDLFIASESQPTYKKFTVGDDLIQARFFLIAVSRRSHKTP